MKSEWHTDEFISKTEQKVEDVLFLTGQQVVTWASGNFLPKGTPSSDKPRVDTSNLINSLTCATADEQSELRGPVEPGVTPITNPNKLSVRIGSNAAYAARIELGFRGQDSKGRNYNQSPRPYLVPAVEEHKQEILNFINKHINE